MQLARISRAPTPAPVLKDILETGSSAHVRPQTFILITYTEADISNPYIMPYSFSTQPSATELVKMVVSALLPASVHAGRVGLGLNVRLT